MVVCQYQKLEQNISKTQQSASLNSLETSRKGQELVFLSPLAFLDRTAGHKPCLTKVELQNSGVSCFPAVSLNADHCPRAEGYSPSQTLVVTQNTLKVIKSYSDLLGFEVRCGGNSAFCFQWNANRYHRYHTTAAWGQMLQLTEEKCNHCVHPKPGDDNNKGEVVEKLTTGPWGPKIPEKLESPSVSLSMSYK